MSYSDDEMDNDEDRIAKCVRQVANMSRVNASMLMDTKVFNVSLLQQMIPRGAPKLVALFEKIAALDAQDLKRDKKLYKHIIFTDSDSSNYGAKLLASAFVAYGFVPAFTKGLGLKKDEELMDSSNKNFGLLLSKTFGKKSMSVKFKKAQMLKYNQRPENVHGALMRFIILDQGFKEGIDLFDVKYVHLFEPVVSRADEKQAIGRGTRFCGQKGLEFHPRYGWPLYVFRYDVRLAGESKTFFELYVKYLNLDFRRVVFAAELEKAVVEAAVDKLLTAEVHSFEIEEPPPVLEGGAKVMPPVKKMGLAAMQEYVKTNFMKFRYPKVKLENKCVESGGGITFTPTQDFIRHFFLPGLAYKGMLLFHSVGTGKTCTGIACAAGWELEGYTIMWVTRHTLKADIYKNMFGAMSCTGKEAFAKMAALKKNLSKAWIEPMSYKQFSNMLLQANRFYEEIVKRNGEEDPLRKTLVIIDEAHKLYAENVSGSEKPRMDILEKMIQNSYKKSGKDSVRVLLMTATPYTNDGMEMMKLLNLLREDPMETDFEAFGEKYLNEDGMFTKGGLKKFQDRVSGYISYLNRARDARNFAHPVIENVFVNATAQAEKEKPEKHLDGKVKEVTKNMKELRMQLRAAKANDNRKERIKDCKEEAKQAYQEGVEQAKEAKTNACVDVAKGEKARCRDKAAEAFRVRMEELKREKAAGFEKCKDLGDNEEVIKILETMEHKKEEREGVREVLKNFRDKNRELGNDIRELSTKAAELRDDLRELTNEKKRVMASMKKAEEAEKKKLAKVVVELNEKIKPLREELEVLRQRMTTKRTDKKLKRIEVGRGVLGDVSQMTALNKRCLHKN